MLTFLADAGIPALVVLTQVDKLAATRRRARLAAIASQLGVEDEEQVVPFSAVTREGREDILRAVEGLVEEARPS